MTYTEKADLAKQYLNVFGSHYFTFIAVGLVLAIIFAIFFVVGMARQSDSTLLSAMGLVLSCALMTCSVFDAPNFDHNAKGLRVSVDTLIVRYHRKLPHVQHVADVNYRKAQKSHGIKAYLTSKKYYENHRKAKTMEHYLSHHTPKSPWINCKFLPKIEIKCK